MRRTRLSAKRNQDGCPLFIDLQAARIIISKLPNLDRASLALTCSLAATTVHSEVTALDLTRGSAERTHSSSASSSATSSSAAVTARTISRSTQLLQRCLHDPRWARLELLALPFSFYSGICSEAAQVAQRWPHLRTLKLTGSARSSSQPGSAGRPILLAAFWTQLSCLHLKNIELSVVGAQHLAQARLDGIQELCLENNWPRDTAHTFAILAWLLNAPWPHLASLTISRNHLGRVHVQHLAEAKQLTALTKLGLQHNALDAEGVQALAAGTHLRLQELDLSGNGGLRDDSFHRLMEATHIISGLRSLALGSANITGLRSMAAATNLSALTYLDLVGNDYLCLLELVDATHLSTLRHLELGHSSRSPDIWYPCMGRHGPEALSKMLLPNLTTLVIKNVNLAGQLLILSAAALPQLSVLELACANLHRNDLLDLAEACWPQLLQLDLRGNDGLKAPSLKELWPMRRNCPALRSLVVPYGVSVQTVQARLAKGAWAGLVVAAGHLD